MSLAILTLKQHDSKIQFPKNLLRMRYPSYASIREFYYSKWHLMKRLGANECNDKFQVFFSFFLHILATNLNKRGGISIC